MDGGDAQADVRGGQVKGAEDELNFSYVKYMVLVLIGASRWYPTETPQSMTLKLGERDRMGCTSGITCSQWVINATA